MLYLIACNDFPYSLSFCLYATDKKKRYIILHTQIQVHLLIQLTTPDVTNEQ